MPLDRPKARSLVNSSESYRGPNADFIHLIAEQLHEALKVLDDAAMGVVSAQRDVATIKMERDDALAALTKIQEQAKHTDAMVALLREIAKTAKGASKKAAELIELIGAKEQVVVPDIIVVE